MSTKFKIFLVNSSGFCFGVKNAVQKTINLIKENPQDIFYTYGDLIHNPQVIEKLKNYGIKSIENLTKIKKAKLIIRTHGAPLSIYQQAQKQNLKIIDLTCPVVIRSQKIAEKLFKENYQIFILGDKNHPEIKSIFSRTQNKAIIINDLKELKNIKIKTKVGVLSQTTQKIENLQQLIAYLLPKTLELKIFNTICNATTKNQKETKKLAKIVDLMLVIGGKNSANTTKLKQICEEEKIKTYHIETKDEIKKQWFKNVQKIGITAGTSTPDWIIKEVVEYLEKI